MRNKNKCSLTVYNNDSGRQLYGTAAVLHATSKAGGFDQFMQDYGTDVLQSAYEKLNTFEEKKKRKPSLRVV